MPRAKLNRGQVMRDVLRALGLQDGVDFRIRRADGAYHVRVLTDKAARDIERFGTIIEAQCREQGVAVSVRVRHGTGPPEQGSKRRSHVYMSTQ